MAAHDNRIRIILISVIVLGTAIVFLSQSLPETRRVIIVNDCRDVERMAELYKNVERLIPYLFEHGIDTAHGDTLPGCGYILQWGDRAVQIDTIMSARDLKTACQRFFQLDTLDQTTKR